MMGFIRFLTAFETGFVEDSIKFFEETGYITAIRVRKNQWSYSSRRYDYGTSVMARLLNWVRDEETAIATHHHMDISPVYMTCVGPLPPNRFVARSISEIVDLVSCALTENWLEKTSLSEKCEHRAAV
jgi:hypothetical protein